MKNTKIEHGFLDYVLAGLEEARGVGRRIFDMWREERPLIPIPGMLKSADGRGSVAITPSGYQALSDWCHHVWNEDNALSEAITLEEWRRYVFDNFLRTCITVFDQDAPREICEIHFYSTIRTRLVTSALKGIPAELFFLYPLIYAREPLSERLKLGPLTFIPPDDALAEIESSYKNTSPEAIADVRTDTLIEIEKFSKRITCFVKVSVVGLGGARGDQWARAVARLGVVALLAPYGVTSVTHARFADEARETQRVHFGYRVDFPSAPGWSWEAPRLEKGDVINEKDSEYLAYKDALARLLSTYISPSAARTDAWRCYRLGEIWLSAVHWFYRAVTADLDSEAVVALGTCLNVLGNGLSGGKMSSAISKIIKVGENDVVLQRPVPVTLKELMVDLYSQGRSRVIHGTRDAIKEDYSLLRQRGQSLAINVLLRYWHELFIYEKAGGNDNFGDFLASL